VPAAYFESTSHKATICSPSMSRKSAAPMPPTPTPAIFSFSLGALNPAPPSTCRGTIVNAPNAAAPARKSRRVGVVIDLLQDVAKKYKVELRVGHQFK
jgi:hypothetical protein